MQDWLWITWSWDDYPLGASWWKPDPSRLDAFLEPEGRHGGDARSGCGVGATSFELRDLDALKVTRGGLTYRVKRERPPRRPPRWTPPESRWWWSFVGVVGAAAAVLAVLSSARPPMSATDDTVERDTEVIPSWRGHRPVIPRWVAHPGSPSGYSFVLDPDRRVGSASGAADCRWHDAQLCPSKLEAPVPWRRLARAFAREPTQPILVAGRLAQGGELLEELGDHTRPPLPLVSEGDCLAQLEGRAVLLRVLGDTTSLRVFEWCLLVAPA